ncbi:phosphonate metabolism protein/1,5-bisphosphokinase (PRPP-forming) PhnN [Roseibium marinum]|uniref:Ribose 1,5-bisphosphate phosphokinase PhnN n=1 Tax=Roseibium marinum TaxID=281252 RepID=A0A2S3UZ37_9HYPH|nr:phosphonate metabolism protein/1,5-bisphosphokinase (PRPP-forming) PhnN [Roseibium marinum]POF32729.1 ribose 1,5-bisphosphokinase [Roseibium marinum]
MPKLGPGRMVLVVGPSGAGKDTLMAALKARLRGRSDVQFARRAITRQADADAEDHDTLDRAGFERLVATGEVALAWEAHGLGYVIPKACDEIIRTGGTVIANGSRRVLKQAERKYENAVVLLITAPVEILAERLAARGRETRQEIRKRLERADLEPENVANLIRIENTGTVEGAVERMMAALAF